MSPNETAKNKGATSADERPWFALDKVDDIDTPALLIYADRMEENIKRVVAIAGNAKLLRPHVKTHKLGQVIERHLAVGVDKFKAATPAEAEMVAKAGGKDILLALQPVGLK